MAMSMSSGGAVKAEPNVTPMIDVMLVLLIIFMIVVPALNAGFNATPPKGTNLKLHPEEEGDQVLGIDVHGVYFLNKKPIRKEDLGTLLSQIYANREEKVLYIKADRGLDYGVVLNAMDVAAHNGVRVSGMITEQTPGTQSAVASDNVNMMGSHESTTPVENPSAAPSTPAGGTH